MKHKLYFIALLNLIFSSILISQEQPQWGTAEIFMMTTGLVSGESVRYKLEAVGTRWKTDEFSPPSNHQITSEYGIAYYPIINQDPATNTDFGYISGILGFNWMFAGEPQMDNICHGLYKLSVTPGNQYLYLDYRDDRYPISGGVYSVPGGNDIWILYDKAINKFKYSPVGLNNPNSSAWIIASRGAYLGLWDIKGVSTPMTIKFPNFWQNSLSLVDNGSSCPRLIWGAYPNNNVTVLSYKVYRSVTNDTYPPPADNFLPLETKACSVFTHEDYQYTFHGPFTLKY